MSVAPSTSPAARRRQGQRRPYWPAVTVEVLREPASLARVLAGMFDLHCGVVPRGSIVWWQPDYLRAGGAALRRDEAASYNRVRRDAAVHLMCGLPERRLFLIDAYDGEWRDASGARRGEDLIALGMLRWDCGYGQAGNRIARICGFAVPTVEDGPADVWGPVRAAMSGGRPHAA